MAYTTIDKPEDYFNTITWTGDGSRPISITGVGFQPDMVWAKNRSPDAFEHKLYDSSRGAGSDKELTPNEAYAEGGSNADTYGYLSSFDSDGFSSTDSNYNAYFNKIGTTYVAWAWKANAGSTSSNTNGTITSTVQVNSDAGFSIGTFTGNGTSGATVGHGLGVKPDMLILKSRNNPSGAAMYWIVGHVGLDGMAGLKNLFMNQTWAVNTESVIWANTAPTSSVFSVGTNAAVNYTGNNMLFYAFANKQGYSKFGQYTGNGNADGPFVYTGFRPAFVMVKNASASESWVIYDTARNTYNVADLKLSPDTADSENGNAGIGGAIYNNIDILSNGFKCRTNNAATNGSGNTIIYMAFAENPFVTSTGIPTTAR